MRKYILNPFYQPVLHLSTFQGKNLSESPWLKRFSYQQIKNILLVSHFHVIRMFLAEAGTILVTVSQLGTQHISTDNQCRQTRAGKRALNPYDSYNKSCVCMIVSHVHYLCVVVLVAAGLGNVITGPAPTNLNLLQKHKYMDTQSPTLGVNFLVYLVFNFNYK